MTAMMTPAAPAETDLAKAPKKNTLAEMLEARRSLIANVLPKHMTPERLIKLATVAMGRDPTLGRATGLSIVNAVIKAAELGLDCSGTLGSAYLVPFKVSKKNPDGTWRKETEAQLIIGYRGLIDLARRSGQIASIEARVVWEKDLFEFEYGLEPKLKHVPTLDVQRGELKLVYGIGKLRDGSVQIEVMTRAEIDSIKGRSQSSSSEKSPWKTDYPEMARKTVVKRLCKYLPMSVEFADAIAADNVADPLDVIDGSVIENAADRVNAKVNAQPKSQSTVETPDPGTEDDTGAADQSTGPDDTDLADAAQDAMAEPPAEERSVEEKPAETKASAPTTATPSAREQFRLRVTEVGEAAGFADKVDLFKRVDRYLMTIAMKGKEAKLTPEQVSALMHAIESKSGPFADATA